jgi:glyoxylase-like metal-dependent hydrolase (beta-lactamase superfamily II)
MRKYMTTRLDEDTYCIEQKLLSFRCLCYLLLGKERALLIDTAFVDEGLAKTVEGLCPLPLDVALTHAHLDHIGNAHRFPRVYMCEKDRPVFELHSDKSYVEGFFSMVPLPARLLLRNALEPILETHPETKTIPCGDGHVFDLGGRKVEVVETPGHSLGSVCLLERGRKRLYSGDTVCDIGILLHLDGCLGPDVYLSSIKKLKALEGVREICTGHRQSRIDTGYIGDYEKCAEGIVDGALKAKEKGGALAARLGRVSITYKKDGGYGQ